MKAEREIFENLDGWADSEYNTKKFLNCMYEDGCFVDAIWNIVNRVDIIHDSLYCLFPEWDIDEPIAHFEGVKFLLCDDALVISEAACSAIVDQACTKYLQLHPEDAAELNETLRTRLF